MKKLTVNQMETTKGGRFWGTTMFCSECTGGMASCYTKSYVFWIVIDESDPFSTTCDW
ncbi:MAG: hypothetical protein LBP63_07755 [Prevotellaceae bacterium]|jgi:hypothetical protein|nr:hypothetical protein [Prevotellaceae bacterium]